MSEAFQYFNSLNSRGKDLIGIDVLKAYHYGAMERAAKDFKKEIDSLLGNYSRENSEIDRNCVVLHLTIDIQRNIQNKALELFGSSLLIEDILKGIQLIDNYDYKNNISGTPVVVKHFRIKFFFSLAKQDLFPYFFGCLVILFEVKCVCCCIQKRPIYQSLQAVSRTSIDSICLP